MAEQLTHRQSNTPRGPEEAAKLRQVDLGIILRDILRNWLLILLAGVMAASLYGSYLNQRYTPTYKTETTFFVGENGVNTAFASKNLSGAESMTENLTAIVNSEILNDKVAYALGKDRLDAKINVSSVPSTNLMKISVEAGSPKSCYDIIHLVVEESLAICHDLNSNICILTLSEAAIPTKPSNPLHLRKGMVRAGLIGMLAMMVLLVAFAYFRDTVKNETYFEKQVNAGRIVTIAHERKVKTFSGLFKRKVFSLLLTNPALSFRFTESNKMLATKVRLEMKKLEAKSIMVTSFTENEGKSTVAANLALALSQAGYKVCLLDCDFRKPAQYKIFQAKKDRFASADLNALLKGNNNLKLVPLIENTTLYGMLTFDASNQTLAKRTLRIIGELIKQLEQVVDIIVIDSAPWGLVAEGINIAAIADSSLLVVEQDYASLHAINDTIDQIREVSAGFIGCVFNNVSSSIAGNSNYGYGGYYGYGAYRRYGKVSDTPEENLARSIDAETLAEYEEALKNVLAQSSISGHPEEDTHVRIETLKGE